MNHIYYHQGTTEAEQEAAEDAMTLIKAWQIRGNTKRLKAARNVLRDSHYIIKQVCDLTDGECLGIE